MKNCLFVLFLVFCWANESMAQTSSNNTAKMAVCPICYGQGSVFIDASFSMPCLACYGSGKVNAAVAEEYVKQRALNGGSGNNYAPRNSSGTRKKDCRVCYNTGNCQTCLGRGEVVNQYTGKWSYCNTCNKNYENANNPRKKGKCYACSW